MSKANRGRIQAQGGTEKSVAWARDSPPTEREMLAFVDQLESKLTESERNARAVPLAELRRFISAAAEAGGLFAPLSRTFLKKGSKNIRIDIEVRTGTAAG